MWGRLRIGRTNHRRGRDGMDDPVTASIEIGDKVHRVPGRRVTFSPARLFRFDGSAEEDVHFRRLIDVLRHRPGLVLLGDGPLLGPLLTIAPDLRHTAGFARNESDIPGGAQTVFITALDAVARFRARQPLPAHLDVLDVSVLADVAADSLPRRAWTPIGRNIYPIPLPDIRFGRDLDLLLLDCPARNLALMPNGLGYVHNVLKQTSLRFETFDVDIVAYHRFHITRLFDLGGTVVLPSGRALPADPWKAEHYDLWRADDVLEYFAPLIDETADAVIAARPRVLGLSIHQCNEHFSRALVAKVRQHLPDIQVIVGGFSCYSPDIGRRAFPESDYMVIGEGELTIAPLVEDLAQGLRPRNLPGVLSRHDDPDRVYIPGPMPHDLDRIDFPKYEWFDLSIYRNFDGYQLTPIIASRGCRWSRCTFCAERFFWRIRSAEAFVDELEWLADHGCSLFMFNESDLNGMPDKLLEICDEIIRRNVHVKLTGQLRIHKKSDKAFFQKLRAAGFVSLRFGVDAWAANTMRLQKKGYTPDIVIRNLRDCWEAGIYTEVNWVVGVPGETWEDVEEGIGLILKTRQYIGRLANINPLIFVNGSVYWLDPEAHNIRFRQPRDDLYRAHWRALPADQWYSEDPYIDHEVRTQYFQHIVVSLHEAQFPVGEWAQRIIEDVKSARDPHRSGKSGDRAAAPRATTDGRADERPNDGLPAAPKLVFHKGYWYALETDAGMPIGQRSLRSWLRLAGRRAALRARDAASWDQAAIRSVVSRMAQPELLRVVGTYNIVAFDGCVYAVPHGLAVDWMAGDAETLPDILAGPDLANVLDQVKRVLGLDAAPAVPPPEDRGHAAPAVDCEPVVVGTIDDYTILSFEGWYYGLPEKDRDLDLAEVDILERPGIIKDLSRDVVEAEVLERRAHASVH